jgi:hypothetical protein
MKATVKIKGGYKITNSKGGSYNAKEERAERKEQRKKKELSLTLLSAHCSLLF